MVADFQHFELLFESAIEAFVDTYFRESVSSFAAALERFYEFAIQTLLVDRKVAIETIRAMWKPVSNQSERQLGMFIGLYTAAHGRPPTLLPDNRISFRNNVIHKGHFPTPQETFDFGNSVYELLNLSLKELRENFEEAMQTARSIARQAAFAQLKDGESAITFGMGTTVSLTVLDEPPPMADAINAVAARLRRQRNQESVPMERA
ncbi:MAG TPA: hypothetical protein VNS79_08000 [Sphingobium sp.]|nr:hypothetical protein [Sphingobium sp.]